MSTPPTPDLPAEAAARDFRTELVETYTETGCWDETAQEAADELLAAHAAAVRTAALTEAADWLVRKYGVTNRAAGDLYRLAAAPTTTTEH